MVICENEPAELPKDVVRSTTKLDDDISQFNLNLVSIWEKFELGTSNNANGSDANGTSNGDAARRKGSSAGTIIEKPSINIKQTLLAFEKGSIKNDDDSNENDWSVGDDDNTRHRVTVVERPKVKKLSNLNGFFDKRNQDTDELNSNGTKHPSSAPVKPLVVKRSESLMMRLRKYESRIAGENEDDDEDDDDDNSEDDECINNNNNNNIKNKNNNKDEDSTSDFTSQSEFGDGEHVTTEKLPKSAPIVNGVNGKKKANIRVPKRLPSIDLSSLKNRWENGDINKRRNDTDEDENGEGAAGENEATSPLIEKHEELCRIRQELARKRSGKTGPVKNIYEDAIQKAQMKEKEAAIIRRDSSDLSTLTKKLSTTEIQQRLLQSTNNNGNNSNSLANGHTSDSGENETPNTPTSNKDHFQLNISKKANKLRERFELGLVNNSSYDDSDASEGDEGTSTMTKLEQLRQEKLEELNVFKNGKSEAREARNLFKQIDKQISGASSEKPQPNQIKPRSFVKSKMSSMRSKMNGVSSQPSEESIQTPVSTTSPRVVATTQAPAAKDNTLINNHNQEQPQLIIEQQRQQKAQQSVQSDKKSAQQQQHHLEQTQVVPEVLEAVKQPTAKQQQNEEAVARPAVVSPIKEQLASEAKSRKPAESFASKFQVQMDEDNNNSVKEENLNSLKDKHGLVKAQLKHVEVQPYEKIPQQQQQQHQAEARLHLEQVNCPVIIQQKVESQPQSRKQRQETLEQQPKQEQQPELQPRQPRQSQINQQPHKHKQQQVEVQQLPGQQQQQSKKVEQLTQPQQQKLVENQPIRLTNNCKNVSKMKMMQSN